MRRIDIGLVLCGVAIFILRASPAQTLEARPEFDAKMTTPAKNGAAQPFQITIQSWGLPHQNAAQEIPLRGFYVAHLLGGAISTTIDGQTAERAPGDYWTVKTGASMQIKVKGEFAVLETIVVGKQ